MRSTPRICRANMGGGEASDRVAKVGGEGLAVWAMRRTMRSAGRADAFVASGPRPSSRAESSHPGAFHRRQSHLFRVSDHERRWTGSLAQDL